MPTRDPPNTPDLPPRAAEVPESVVVPIDGVLDLHSFHPRDIRTLVPDYLEECQKRGITAVRIIHGKGTGALAKGVHALLKRDARVAAFRVAGFGGGGWGATEVDLLPTRPESD